MDSIYQFHFFLGYASSTHLLATIKNVNSIQSLPNGCGLHQLLAVVPSDSNGYFVP